MRNTYTIILLLAAIFTLTTCKKESQSYTISGTISDGGFNKSLQGVTVQLLGSKIESGVYNSNYVEMAQAVTDANGNYSFEVVDELVAGYRFYIHKDNYFDVYEDVETNVLEASATYTKNATLYPQSTVRLKIKNTTPFGTDDLITYRFTNIKSACKECCNNLPQEGNGGTFQIDKQCLVRGEKWVYIYWSVTKNGYTTLDNDSVFCPAFGVGTYELNY